MTTRTQVEPGVFEYRDDQGTLVCRSYESDPTPAQQVEATLRARAVQALTANAAFLALASPTAAQNAAQVGRLTRQVNALCRLMLDDLTAADDT